MTPIYRHSVLRQYKGHVRRHQPATQAQVSRFPLPKWAKWYDCGMGQIVYPIYGVSGGLSMQKMLVLIDGRIPCSGDGIEIQPGLTSGPSGRWYRIDFPSYLPWRKLIPMIKQAIRDMDARA